MLPVIRMFSHSVSLLTLKWLGFAIIGLICVLHGAESIESCSFHQVGYNLGLGGFELLDVCGQCGDDFVVDFILYVDVSDVYECDSVENNSTTSDAVGTIAGDAISTGSTFIGSTSVSGEGVSLTTGLEVVTTTELESTATTGSEGSLTSGMTGHSTSDFITTTSDGNNYGVTGSTGVDSIGVTEVGSSTIAESSFSTGGGIVTSGNVNPQTSGVSLAGSTGNTAVATTSVSTSNLVTTLGQQVSTGGTVSTTNGNSQIATSTGVVSTTGYNRFDGRCPASYTCPSDSACDRGACVCVRGFTGANCGCAGSIVYHGDNGLRYCVGSGYCVYDWNCSIGSCVGVSVYDIGVCGGRDTRIACNAAYQCPTQPYAFCNSTGFCMCHSGFQDALFNGRTTKGCFCQGNNVQWISNVPHCTVSPAAQISAGDSVSESSENSDSSLSNTVVILLSVFGSVLVAMWLIVLGVFLYRRKQYVNFA